MQAWEEFRIQVTAFPGGLVPARHGQHMACLCHAMADNCNFLACQGACQGPDQNVQSAAILAWTFLLPAFCLAKCNVFKEQDLLDAGLGLSDGTNNDKEAAHQAEALWVSAGLRRDFEAAGINLPDSGRDQADKLTAGIERLRMLIGTTHSRLQAHMLPGARCRLLVLFTPIFMILISCP